MRAIDADELMERLIIDSYIVEHDHGYKSKDYGMTLSGIKQVIHELPTIESEQKGKWIDDGTEFGCCCDSCGITLDEYFMGDLSNITLCKVLKFCPNCGADMRSEK